MFEMWFCQVEGVRRIWNTALIIEHLASMHEANDTVLCSGSSVCAVSMICSHHISRTYQNAQKCNRY